MILNPKIMTVDEYQRVVEAKLGRKDFKIVSLKEAPLETRVGFLADHSRVHVEVEVGGGQQRQMLRFFAKAMPANATCRALVEANGSFEREIFFYEVLSKVFEAAVPLSASTFPTCYLCKPEVLILEDLAPLGFGPVKSTQQAVDLDHCHQVLETLARFHCASIATEERHKRSLSDMYPEHMYEVFITTEHERQAQWLAASLGAARAVLPLLPQFKELPAGPAAARRLQDKFQRLDAMLLDCMQPKPERRNVMCHGDSWISNFLFKYDQQGKPDQAVLLDFQLMRYAPPVYDVQLFLHKSLPFQEGRAQQHAQLLQYYHQRLKQELRAAGLDPAAVLPDDEFHQATRDGARMATIAVPFYMQLCDMPAEFIDALFADQALYDKYVFTDARTEYVTKTYQTDKHFRFVFEHALRDLIDLIMADE